MTDTDTPPHSKIRPRSIARENRFMIRFSDAEGYKVEANAREAGFGNASDYIRDRLFGGVSGDTDRDGHRADGGMLTEKRRGELAVAVLHLYDINEQAFADAGRKEWFDNGRQAVIDSLSLGRLLGSRHDGNPMTARLNKIKSTSATVRYFRTERPLVPGGCPRRG